MIAAAMIKLNLNEGLSGKLMFFLGALKSRFLPAAAPQHIDEIATPYFLKSRFSMSYTKTAVFWHAPLVVFSFNPQSTGQAALA